MDSFSPNSFLEIIGAILIAGAIIFSCLSLFPKIRSQSSKVSAILLVASIGIFSNGAAIYFVALFVIATAVTELEFLQNLAAIVRGNKDYFDYKKESLSIDEVKTRVLREKNRDLAFTKDTSSSLGHESINENTYIRMVLEKENTALDIMEKYFNKKIERNVRIRSNDFSLEVDGLISSRDSRIFDKIIEVKYIKEASALPWITDAFRSIEELAEEYQEITGKAATLHLVLIVDDEQGLDRTQEALLKHLIDTSCVPSTYSVLTRKELDISPVGWVEERNPTPPLNHAIPPS